VIAFQVDRVGCLKGLGGLDLKFEVKVVFIIEAK